MADGLRRDVRFEEALAAARAHGLALPPEPVPVARLTGRLLAEDVRAGVDNPAFTNSAMDGYAVRASDGAGPRRLVGESRAGAPFSGTVGPGEAVRISTGAELPEGADAVVRLEDASEAEGRVTPAAPPAPGDNVRRRGEDVRRGQVLLRRGSVVRAHEVAVAASTGRVRVKCARRPRIALLLSGDEVVGPGEPLAPGRIYDANGPGIAAQAEAAGAEVVARRRVGDSADETVAALRALLEREDGAGPDLVVTVGGVSVGRHDHLRAALAAAGVRGIIAGVQMRPGHPLWLGARGEQMVLALPGNPVSAAVCFHVFGRTLLGRGDSWERTAPLARAYRATTRRAELVRCREVAGGLMEPLPQQGSHAFTSLAGATHLALVPAGGRDVPAGGRVHVCRLV